VIEVVRAAFQAWENVAPSTLRYRFSGTTTATNGLDLQNIVTFSPQGFTFPPQFPGGIFPLIFAAVRAGPVTIPGGPTITAAFAGQVLDGDIVINPQGRYTISDVGPPPFGTFDLQGVLAHEIGHLSGLNHTGINATTMYAFFTQSGGFFQRTLEPDDAIGITTLYPSSSFLDTTGRILGTVRRPDGRPVFGVHVVAIHADTGVVATSAITGLVAIAPNGMPLQFSQTSGDYLLTGLPPGSYTIVAEPLDGPGLPFLGGVFGTGSGGESFIETDFLPAFSAIAITVAPGQLVSGVALTVGNRPASAPNLAAYSFAKLPSQPFIAPAMVLPGTSPILSIGHGENIVSGGTLLSGTTFQFSGGDITIGTPTVRDTDILLPLTVPPTAPLGPRVLLVTTPNGSSVFSGAVIVVSDRQQSGIMATFEGPDAGPVSGIAVIRGWAFATQAGVQISSVDLFIDGVRITDIPCCSERADVQAAFPQFPAANTLNSGWGITVNWGNLNTETHKVQVEIRSTVGEIFSTETRTVTVVKPGDFPFLDRFTFSGTTARIQGDELVVEDIVVRDKATQQQKRINARFRWFTSSQSMQTVEAVTTATLSSRSLFTEMFSALSARIIGLSNAASAQATPGIVQSFESPEEGQAASGIAVIRGWAFADVPSASIQEVRLVVDGQPGNTIPCCSSRGDVAAAFPTNPNALQSGWGIVVNYGNLSAGFHSLGVRIGDSTGASLTLNHGVTAVKLGGFDFLDQFSLFGVTASIAGEEIVMTGVQVRDKASQQTRVITVRLRWLQSSQALGIVASAG
jgi:hypothetical protein